MQHRPLCAGSFDPLAALDAEYAAVVAQSRTAAPAASLAVAAPAPPAPEDLHSESESDDEAPGFAGDSYALLPSSPCHSEEAFRDEEHGDSSEGSGQIAADGNDAPEVEPEQTEKPAEMETATRQTIMQSMQQMKLRPPPWAQAAEISDAELLDLVQQQLGLGPRASAAPDANKHGDTTPS